MKNPPVISIVVPCYNEGAVLSETVLRLGALLDRLEKACVVSPDSHVIFVDDGSRDRTWPLILDYASRDVRMRGLRLSRNRGHQNAVLAGMFSASGDAVVTIDADLQDDVDAIEKMVNAYRDGKDVVYGVRSSRSSDTFFKRWTAESYYRVLALFGVEIIFNHADYRLMSRRALAALSEFSEVNLFLRGVVPQIGFESGVVEYARAERFAGESKYPLKKMLALAWQGVTSFSVTPLRFITGIGTIISCVSFALGAWALIMALLPGHTVPGWASTVIPIYVLGGVQLIGIGVVGEYVGKTYFEVKRRPRYFVSEVVGDGLVAHGRAGDVDNQR